MRNRMVFGIALIVFSYLALSPQIAWPLYSAVLFQPGQKVETDAPWQKAQKDFGVTRRVVWFEAKELCEGVGLGWLT